MEQHAKVDFSGAVPDSLQQHRVKLQRHGTHQGASVGVVGSVAGENVVHVQLTSRERLLGASSQRGLSDGGLEVARLAGRCAETVHNTEDGSALLEHRVTALPHGITAPVLGGLARANEGDNVRLSSSLHTFQAVSILHDVHRGSWMDWLRDTPCQCSQIQHICNTQTQMHSKYSSCNNSLLVHGTV